MSIRLFLSNGNTVNFLAHVIDLPILLISVFVIRLDHTGSDKARHAKIYLYVLYILCHKSLKEHISLLPRVAPCRFRCEQALTRLIIFTLPDYRIYSILAYSE